ncbi:MAG: hypothetical protein ACYSSL_06365 [Planctomycetota bacterium]
MRRTRGQERRGAKVVVVWEWSGDWASDGGACGLGEVRRRLAVAVTNGWAI